DCRLRDPCARGHVTDRHRALGTFRQQLRPSSSRAPKSRLQSLWNVLQNARASRPPDGRRPTAVTQTACRSLTAVIDDGRPYGRRAFLALLAGGLSSLAWAPK